MHQAILPREHFHERTELLDRDDAALVGLADLDLGAERLDLPPGNFHALGRDREHLHRAIVLDVDLATRLIDDALDILSARPDEQTDLLRVDPDDRDPRSVLGDVRPGSGQRLRHLGEDRQTGLAGRFDRLGHDRQRDAAQLQIELEAGDALVGARQLAVHVAECVFPADDVGEQAVTADLVIRTVLGADTDRDAGHRAGQRNTGIHERQGGAADRRHGGRTIRLHDFGRDPDGVRVFLQGNHRGNGTFREGSVTDLTTTGARDAAGLADREVLVKQELLLRLATRVGVDLLDIVAGTQGREANRLRLTTGEHGRTMRTGQDPDFARDRSNLVK